MSTEIEPLLLGKEVQRLAKISQGALRNLVAQGVLTPVRLGNRLIRFKASDVRTFLDGGAPPPAAKPYKGKPRGRPRKIKSDEV